MSWVILNRKRKQKHEKVNVCNQKIIHLLEDFYIVSSCLSLVHKSWISTNGYFWTRLLLLAGLDKSTYPFNVVQFATGGVFFLNVGINVPLRLMVPLLSLHKAGSDALEKEIKKWNLSNTEWSLQAGLPYHSLSLGKGVVNLR